MTLLGLIGILVYLDLEISMNCYHCNDELIWGGDHDCSEDNEDYMIETNLSCNTCGSLVIVYLPREEEVIEC
jgi:hypothetical protein